MLLIILAIVYIIAVIGARQYYINTHFTYTGLQLVFYLLPIMNIFLTIGFIIDWLEYIDTRWFFKKKDS